MVSSHLCDRSSLPALGIAERIAHVALVLLIVAARSQLPLVAQTLPRTDSPVERASTLVRLSDGEILIGADSSRGVYVVPRVAGHSGLAPVSEFAARYDPSAVLQWLPTADSVLHAATPATTDQRRSIQTQVLRNRRGGGVLAGRFRAGAAWATEVILDFRVSRSWKLILRAQDPDEAQTFLDALHRAALASQLREDDVRADACSRARWDDSGSVALEPPRLEYMAPPQYPAALGANPVSGVVVVEYVVGADGRVDETTIDILFASRPELVDPIHTALAATTFRPARVRRAPVPVCLTHAYTFGPPP